MQQQIISELFYENCEFELLNRLLKEEKLTFELFNLDKEFDLSLIYYLIKELHFLKLEYLKQTNFLNSPPQYKENYKYINESNSCLVIFTRETIKLIEDDYGLIEEKNFEESILVLKPPEPTLEESRVLLN